MLLAEADRSEGLSSVFPPLLDRIFLAGVAMDKEDIERDEKSEFRQFENLGVEISGGEEQDLDEQEQKARPIPGQIYLRTSSKTFQPTFPSPEGRVRPKFDRVSTCPLCGHSRGFEFQVYAESLRELIEPKKLGWDSLLVFSCLRPCNPPEGYAEDLVILYFSPSAVKDLPPRVEVFDVNPRTNDPELIVAKPTGSPTPKNRTSGNSSVKPPFLDDSVDILPKRLSKNQNKPISFASNMNLAPQVPHRNGVSHIILPSKAPEAKSFI